MDGFASEFALNSSYSK